jgi:hypothetical protein
MEEINQFEYLGVAELEDDASTSGSGGIVDDSTGSGWGSVQGSSEHSIDGGICSSEILASIRFNHPSDCTTDRDCTVS